MSDLGTAARSVANALGVEDTGRDAAAIRVAIAAVMNDNRARSFYWNIKEWTLTPLVVGQYVYAQGATTSDLPEDWVAPLEPAGPGGDPTAWIAETGDLDTRYEFELVNYGRYQRLRAQYGDTTGRPRFWAVYDESMVLVPAADVVTYKIFGSYVYNTDENFAFGLDADQAWSGSNDSYTSDWFDPEKGFHTVVNGAVAKLRAGRFKDQQGAAAAQLAMGESLAAMARRAGRNEGTGRIAPYWGR